MFKAKYKKDGNIYQILDTDVDVMFKQTYFLLWKNNGWRWYPANNFVPPNWEEKKDEKH